jgi:hypothetical protein
VYLTHRSAGNDSRKVDRMGGREYHYGWKGQGAVGKQLVKNQGKGDERGGRTSSKIAKLSNRAPKLENIGVDFSCGSFYVKRVRWEWVHCNEAEIQSIHWDHAGQKYKTMKSLTGQKYLALRFRFGSFSYCVFVLVLRFRFRVGHPFLGLLVGYIPVGLGAHVNWLFINCQNLFTF